MVTTIQRKTTVRYYQQVNPGKAYPLQVFLSKEKIQKIKLMEQQAQKEGKGIQVSSDKPEIMIIPSFAGCMVSPPNITVDVTPETIRADFWLTPVILGEIHGNIDFIYQNKTIERIHITIHSVRQLLAKVGSAIAVISPLLSFGFDLLARSAGNSNLPDWIKSNLVIPIGFAIMAISIGCSIYFFIKNRPKEAEPIEKVLATQF